MVTLPPRRPPVLLELDLTEVPVTPDPDDPLARFRSRGKHQLRPTLRALHEAADDPAVRGLVAKLGPALPWSVMQELRLGVAAFARSGKPTLAWAESFAEGASDMASYVLATAFREIWLQPGGSLGLLGVGLETTFLRGALDRLGIEPQLEQRYEYKNAADRVMRRDFTPEHRESLDRLAQSIYSDSITTIATARGLGEAEVRELVDTGPRTAREAAAAGLIDHLGYRDQVYATARQAAGDDSVRLLFADQWRPRPRPSFPSFPPRNKGYVALVEVAGGIAAGKNRRGPMGRQVGSDSVCASLRAALADDQARAVLLHVDSPGGSAVASETIWRDVVRLREAGKPVVVSMGSAAASGGYYISAPADVIVALPATLTGSIGVFGGKMVISGLLERLGLDTASVQHGERALMHSARRPFSDDERQRLSAAIDAIYEDFVGKVAAGRGRPVAEIEGIARGRVWTGHDAVGVGLVDELGGLRDAARIARERGSLPIKAALRRPIHVAPLDRLARPKNSEDPRAVSAHPAAYAALTSLAQLGGSQRLADLTASLGLSDSTALRMPGTDLR